GRVAARAARRRRRAACHPPRPDVGWRLDAHRRHAGARRGRLGPPRATPVRPAACTHRRGHPSAHRRRQGDTVNTELRERDTEPVVRMDTAWARTRRLALREFGPQDHEALVRMHCEPRLRAHLVDDYPMHDAAVVRVFLERLARIYRRHEGLGIWHASLVEAQPVFAGWFNLMPMAERPGEVEIGSRLRPQAWGRGLSLEGGELLLDHAFDR